jgi:hypothetical protein
MPASTPLAEKDNTMPASTPLAEKRYQNHTRINTTR